MMKNNSPHPILQALGALGTLEESALRLLALAYESSGQDSLARFLLGEKLIDARACQTLEMVEKGYLAIELATGLDALTIPDGFVEKYGHLQIGKVENEINTQTLSGQESEEKAETKDVVLEEELENTRSEETPQQDQPEVLDEEEEDDGEPDWEEEALETDDIAAADEDDEAGDVPETLGAYVILEHRAEDAQIMLLSAQDALLGTEVDLIAAPTLGSLSDEELEGILEDARKFTLFDHPAIWPLVEVTVGDGTPVLVEHITTAGSLRETVEDSGPVPIDVLYNWTHDVIEGLEFLERHECHHMAISPDALYINEEGRLILSRVGEGVLRLAAARHGTPLPEHLMAYYPGGRTSAEVKGAIDRFGFGVTLLGALLGEFPEQPEDVAEMMATARERLSEKHAGFADWLERMTTMEEEQQFFSWEVARQALSFLTPESNSSQRKDKVLQTPLTEDKVAHLDASTSSVLVQSKPSSRRLLFGRYEIQEKIGKGAGSFLYSLLDTKTEQLYVCKVFSPTTVVKDLSVIQGVQRDLRLLNRLDHNAFLPVHMLRDYRDTFVVIRDWFDGKSIASIVEEKGALPYKIACQVFASVAEGVYAAHQAGILHLDIKPENILIDKDGRVRVSDFSVPRLLKPQLARRCNVPYTAPEVLSGAPANAQSDLYSLGATFYFALSGEQPPTDSDFDAMGSKGALPFQVPVEVLDFLSCTFRARPEAREVSFRKPLTLLQSMLTRSPISAR